MHSSGGLGLADAGMEIWAGMALLGLLGFVLGFALNHKSICTIIATRELVLEKRPARFIALVECAVWATILYAIRGISPAMPQGWSERGHDDAHITHRMRGCVLSGHSKAGCWSLASLSCFVLPT
jgi:hypothetical protein